MGNFKFEDYRQPWETGPHWELKQEFIEKYSDMFPEDRLLCLAQAYSNIVLMNCCYPDPVMRQISVLSQPLKMRKRFQESDKSAKADTPTPTSEQQRVSEKIKSIYENSGRPFKQVKFCASKEQSSPSSDSIISHENVSKQYQNECNLLAQNQQISQKQSDSVSIGTVSNVVQNQVDVTSSDCKSQENVLQLSDDENNVLITLGLEFIQKFVQHIRYFQTKLHSPVESIMYAAQKLKIGDKISYDISPDLKCHPLVFVSKLSINNCLISTETGENKRKAKLKSSETAVDILIKLCNLGVSVINVPDLNTAAAMNDSVNHSQSLKKTRNVDKKICDDMGILQTFSENIVGKTVQPVLVFLKNVAEELHMQNYIALHVIADSKSPQNTEYTCKFFIKNILISSGKSTAAYQAKCLAVESGFTKLTNLSNYEIQNGELKEQQKCQIPKPSNVTASDSNTNNSFIKTSGYERTYFILNNDMFNSSRTDNFVLVDNLSLKAISQRNLRTMLSESANFCRKQFSYDFDEMPGSNPPSKKVQVHLGEEIVGTAIAPSKEEAKILACDRAIDMLRKKYYTIKVKNEYIDGYIISRNQVFEGESFSSGALTDSNIGCKMLKSMGWTGGGLGVSGISEPVEAQGHHSFGSGLGYGRDMNDVRLFKRRIDSMLQDFSKTNTLSDLVFSKEFSKEERKEIHRIAGKYHLNTASRGKAENRFLTVRHKYNVSQVLQYLAKNGGTSSKFELIDASEKPFEL